MASLDSDLQAPLSHFDHSGEFPALSADDGENPRHQLEAEVDEMEAGADKKPKNGHGSAGIMPIFVEIADRIAAAGKEGAEDGGGTQDPIPASLKDGISDHPNLSEQ